MSRSPSSRSSIAHSRLAMDDYVRGILTGDRAMLARAITLVESSRPSHQTIAGQVLQKILPATGNAQRIGITGVPGVGKSTLIDQLGMNLVEQGHKIAVLTIDPTSSRSGGSILGDKTRMNRLAQSKDAFIRPSPTSGTLGGVTRKTRETMALCEAAGFDVIIVETVGVGQSETAVAAMVDFFCVLLLAGGGDDLQGIKKGIIELADLIVINKADGDNIARANRAIGSYRAALNILTPHSPNWTTPVISVSGLHNVGLDKLWEQVGAHRKALEQSGEFLQRRQSQAVKWMREMLEDRLMAMLHANRAVAAQLPKIEEKVRQGRLTPALAVEEVMSLMGQGDPSTLKPSGTKP